MQEIIFKAGCMIKHAERWVLVLGANYSTHAVFERLFIKPTPARQTSIAYRRFTAQTIARDDFKTTWHISEPDMARP